MSAIITAVVLESNGGNGKRYRADAERDQDFFNAASRKLRQLEEEHAGDLPLIPDEPSRGTYGSNAQGGTYGFFSFGAYFNPRQLVSLTTFVKLVREAHVVMLGYGLEEEYARAVATYLGFAVDRLADYNSTVTRWASHGEYVGNTFTRQALPMVWDYCEVNPGSDQTGGFAGAINWIAMTLSGVGEPAKVTARDAQSLESQLRVSNIITDPPYYDSITYADLSDFFYVWLKRSVGFLHPDFLN